MKNDLLPSTDIPGIPQKKWYEQEERLNIFVPYPLSTVHDQIASTLLLGSIKEKGFWARATKCTGNITGNFLDIIIGIPSGKGSRLNYHVFGELVRYSNGCLIQVAVRDNNTFVIFLVIAALIAFIFINEGAGFGIFATFFFGGFAFLGSILQHTLGVNGVTKAIHKIAVKPD